MNTMSTGSFPAPLATNFADAQSRHCPPPPGRGMRHYSCKENRAAPKLKSHLPPSAEEERANSSKARLLAQMVGPGGKAIIKSLLIFIILLAATHLGFSQTKEGEVNFLNWAQYIDPATITQFQKQTGIKINQSFYSGSDMLQAKLMAGNAGYDVIIPALVDMRDEIHNGLDRKSVV